MDAFDKTGMAAGKILRMRLTNVARFTRNIGSAAFELTAVTLPAVARVKTFCRENFAVKIGSGGRHPAGFVHANVVIHGSRRILRITASHPNQ
jgi:hypothetical protein